MFVHMHAYIHIGMVFLNPKVASLPEHHHLMGLHGCIYQKKIDKREKVGLKTEWPCLEKADQLPDRYLPVYRKPDKYDIIEHNKDTYYLGRMNEGF